MWIHADISLCLSDTLSSIEEMHEREREIKRRAAGQSSAVHARLWMFICMHRIVILLFIMLLLVLQGFPTLKLFPKGEKSAALVKDYEGPRSLQELIKYASEFFA